MGVGEPLLNLKLLEEVYNNELYIKEVLGYEKINYAIATMMPTKLDKLIKLFTNLNIPLKLHFSLHTPINDLHISKREDLWVSTIRNNVKDLRVKTYSPPGREIGSSCGEFTKHYYHEEIETPQQLQEFKDWKTRHQIFEEI